MAEVRGCACVRACPPPPPAHPPPRAPPPPPPPHPLTRHHAPPRPPPPHKHAQSAPEPFDKEVTLCEQLVGYLGKFAAAEEARATEEARDLSNALAGFKPLQASARARVLRLWVGAGGACLPGGRVAGARALTAPRPPTPSLPAEAAYG